MNLQEKGIRERIIFIDQKSNSVTYLFCQKTRSLKNPEEEVQLNTYLQLIFHYHYPPELVRVCETVKMGSATKEADIIVYKDSALKVPFIVVECKKGAISKNAFKEASEQGFSYAVSLHARFLWVSSGNRNQYFELWQQQVKERELNQIHALPFFEKENSFWYKSVAVNYRLIQRIGRSFKRIETHKIPFLNTTLLYIGVISFFHLVLSKMAVEFHPDIYSITKWFWEHWQMNFQWIFNFLGFIAVLLGLTFTNLFLNNQHKIIHYKKKTTRIFWWLALLLFIPVWYIGTEQVGSWWSYDNFSRLDFKANIYFMPYLESLPFLVPLTFLLIWVIQRFGK